MPTKKTSKKPTKQTKAVKTQAVVKKQQPANKVLALWLRLWRKLYLPIRARVGRLLARRPHRSFRMTRRRDYKRSLQLPGYWSFTNHVRRTLWQHKRLFGGVILTYVIVTVVISGFGAQETYSNLAETLKTTSGDLFKGNFGAVGQAGLLLASTLSSGFSPNLTQAETPLEGAQAVLAALAGFFAWLTTIWLLRNALAGHNPRVKDGLYNSGSPVLATVIVGFILIMQLLPAAIAILVFSAAQQSGLLEVGASAMLVWGGVILLSLLSLYWIATSFIAMVIVTLPGMYPMQAIRAAGDLVIGRRLRILFRLLWIAGTVVVAWGVIVIPVILFDSWIKQLLPAISWVPLVPLVIIAMSSLTLVFVSSYIYLLYRRIVDDDAAPA